MKVNFETKDRNMTVLSPDELMQFRDEFEARQFLHMFAHDPGNMETLRRVLGEQLNPFMIAGLTDFEVLDQVATLISRTCVGWVRVELRDIVPPSVVEGNADPNDTEMEDTPLAEEEAEYEEVKPDPVLPPLFPIIARLECEALDLERRLYNITLDLLRYAGFPWPDTSDVADTLQGVAGSTQIGLQEESQGFANQLLGLGDPANLLSTATEIGQKAVTTAERTGVELGNLTGKTAERLGKLLQNDAEAPAPSAVIPVMRASIENQADQLNAITKGASDGLSSLAGGTFEPLDPSQMADLMQGFAAEQGRGVADAVGRATSQLSDRLGVGPDDKVTLPSLSGTLVLEAMTTTTGETAQGIVDSVGRTTDFLAPLGALPRPRTPALGGAAGAGAGGVAGDEGDPRAAAAAAALSPSLGPLTRAAFGAIRPPAWLLDGEGNAPAVVAQMHLTLLDQTEGILRATQGSMDYLGQLKVPVPPELDAEALAAQAEAEAQAALDAQAAAEAAEAQAAADLAAGIKAPGADLGASLMATLDRPLDHSTVRGPGGEPSELGQTIHNTVRSQGVSLVELAVDFTARMNTLAPPVPPRAPAAPALGGGAAGAAEPVRPPPASASREPYTIPAAPPVPDWTPPSPELPAWDILPEAGE